MTIDEKIDQARRHVEAGLRIVERQRILADRLQIQPAADLLALFQQTQRIFEADLADLLGKR